MAHESWCEKAVERRIGVDIGGTLVKIVYVTERNGETDFRLSNAKALGVGQSGNGDSKTERQDATVDSPPSHHAGEQDQLNQADRQTAPIDFSVGGKEYRCAFKHFLTAQFDSVITFLQSFDLEELDCVRVTGGGCFKFYDQLVEALRIRVERCDEVQCAARGLGFALTFSHEVYSYDLMKKRRIMKTKKKSPYPLLLVNIGSGVSILKANSETVFERVSGTCIGGGTALGLCKLVFGASSFQEVIDLSVRGEDTLDGSVGDLFGDSTSTSRFPQDTLACSFGRLYTTGHGKSLPTCVSKTDVARSAVRMVSFNLGYLATLVAEVHGVKHIYFSGKYIHDHDFTIKTITQATAFSLLYKGSGSTAGDSTDEPFDDEDAYTLESVTALLQKTRTIQPSFEALFLVHDGFLGALGAMLF